MFKFSQLFVVLSVLLGFASCSLNKPHYEPNKPKVIAITPAWAEIANNITQGVFKVSSLTDSSTKVADFTPSEKDIADLDKAQVLILNGGGLDDKIVEKVAKKDTILNAFVLGKKAPHSSKYVFYDFPTVSTVAHKLTEKLGVIDPQNKETYEANLKSFTEKTLEPFTSDLQALRHHKHGKGIIAVGTIAHYFITSAHIENKSPRSFVNAPAHEPNKHEVGFAKKLLHDKKVGALAVCAKDTSATTQSLKDEAVHSGVPVLEFPVAPNTGESYAEWIKPLVESVKQAYKD